MGGGGQTVIRVFDASLTPGDLDAGAGDSAITGSNVNFATTYRVFQQTNPLDFSSAISIASGAATRRPTRAAGTSNRSPRSGCSGSTCAPSTPSRARSTS